MTQRRPRILHVFRTYLPDTRGGIQEVIRQICVSTARLGAENRIFTPSPSPEPQCIEGDGARTIRVPLNFEIQSCGFCITGLAEFRRQVAWADVVHYHFPWPFQDLMHFVCRVKKPTLLTYHADVMRQQRLLKLYGPLMNLFLDRVDCIAPTSDIYVETSEVLTRRRDKLCVIPLGIDEQTYPRPDTDSITDVRRQYGEGFFLFVGMLRYYKSLDVLVRACSLTDARVVIAGIGPLAAELKSLSRSLGLNNLVFAGKVSDDEKMAMLQLSRALVFPSHNRAEAFGVTLLEAAMCGKPLITANIESGMKWVNIDGETGVQVAPDDPASLAEALDRLAADDRLCQQLGSGARARFERLFSAEEMGRRYMDAYERVLDRHSR